MRATLRPSIIYSAARCVYCWRWPRCCAQAREQLPLLFGASSETARESVPALLFAVASLPLWGVVRLYASCFYATGQTRRSLFFIFGDPLGASPLFLFLLPPMLGVNGIWAAAPATQALLFLCLLGMFRQDGRRGVQRT